MGESSKKIEETQKKSTRKTNIFDVTNLWERELRLKGIVKLSFSLNLVSWVCEESKHMVLFFIN